MANAEKGVFIVSGGRDVRTGDQLPDKASVEVSSKAAN